MQKSKLTLIIDGNWLLMSRLSVIMAKYNDTDTLCRELKLLIVKSINLVLKTFPAIDNIIFTSDGGSWRNDLPIPSFLEKDNIEYKGTREKDESVDWETIFTMFDDFMTLLADSGITVCKEPGIEGDDWCWYWSNKLNSIGTNCMIWSRDKDLTQLVKRDDNGCFTICWSKDGGVFAEDKKEEDMDFFFNMQFSQNDIIYNDVISKSVKTTLINPNDVIVTKIISGDISDNILPIITKQSKTNPDKKFRISTKDIDLSLNINSEEAVKNYIDKVMHQKNYIGKMDKTEEQVLEHFKYNKKLVYLNEESYPKEILQTLKSKELNNITKNLSKVNDEVTAEANQIKDILEMI